MKTHYLVLRLNQDYIFMDDVSHDEFGDALNEACSSDYQNKILDPDVISIIKMDELGTVISNYSKDSIIRVIEQISQDIKESSENVRDLTDQDNFI